MESGSGSSQFSVNAAMPAQNSPPDSSESGTTGNTSYLVVSETSSRREVPLYPSGSPADTRRSLQSSPDRVRRLGRASSARSPRASSMLKDKSRPSRGEERNPTAVTREDINRSQLIDCFRTIQMLREEVQHAHREPFEIYGASVSEIQGYHRALEEMTSQDMGSEKRIEMLERQRDLIDNWPPTSTRRSWKYKPRIRRMLRD